MRKSPRYRSQLVALNGFDVVDAADGSAGVRDRGDRIAGQSRIRRPDSDAVKSEIPDLFLSRGSR